MIPLRTQIMALKVGETMYHHTSAYVVRQELFRNKDDYIGREHKCVTYVALSKKCLDRTVKITGITRLR